MAAASTRRSKRDQAGNIKSALVLKKIEGLTDTQDIVFAQFALGQHLNLHGFAGTGKAQPLDSLIKTPTGWIKMGDVVLGQQLSMPDGTISLINGIFPQGKKAIYKITFSDGRSTECCDEHLWRVYNYSWGRKPQKDYIKDKSRDDMWRVLSLKEIMEFKGIHPLKIQLPIPIETPDIDLPLDPWLLGILIGDGSLTTQPSFSSIDEEIITRVGQLISVDGYKLTPKSDGVSYGIVSELVLQGARIEGQYLNKYRRIISDLNLNCTSYSKFIPDIYKQASITQKLELIRGLMDSDGCAEKTGGASFTTTSKQLANDFTDIIRSLGGICSIKYRDDTSYTYNGVKKIGAPNYTCRIRVKVPSDLFFLSRKKARCKYKNQYSEFLNLAIKQIEFIGVKEAQCISVDHPEHLYITDNWIVTHNTYLSMYLALKAVSRGEYKKVAIFRSAVASRSIGFLPGNEQEKMAVFEAPYKAICADLYDRGDAYDIQTRNGIIEFNSTSFERGTTYDDTVIIVDECQSMGWNELNTLCTRVGENTRIIFCGDLRQTDLKFEDERSGHRTFYEIIKLMEDISSIEFRLEDIVRSGFVKSWIEASIKYESQNNTSLLRLI